MELRSRIVVGILVFIIIASVLASFFIFYNYKQKKLELEAKLSQAVESTKFLTREKKIITREIKELKESKKSLEKEVDELRKETKVPKSELKEKIPSDIPLHPYFEWTNPEKSKIFSGDKYTQLWPGDLTETEWAQDEGRVIFSNKVKNVSSDDVLNFYTKKLTENGWKEEFSPAPGGGSSWSMQYTKGKRVIRISFADNAFYTASPPITDSFAGYRVRILYR
ncbi:MAG: hypothetical protein HY776_06855 [Actinobacteria bacterium]|nr:hypothetical protein [Actinomycetota bacterium]